MTARATRATAMMGSVCPRCMRIHAPPACEHDCTAPCPQCGEPIGLLTAEMDGTRCWWCISGLPRVAAPNYEPIPEEEFDL